MPTRLKYSHNDGYNYFFRLGLFDTGKELSSSPSSPGNLACTASLLFQGVIPPEIEYGDVFNDGWTAPSNLTFVAIKTPAIVTGFQVLSDLIDALSTGISTFTLITWVWAVYQASPDMSALPSEYYSAWQNGKNDPVGAFYTPLETANDWLETPGDFSSRKSFWKYAYYATSMYVDGEWRNVTLVDPSRLQPWDMSLSYAVDHFLSVQNSHFVYSPYTFNPFGGDSTPISATENLTVYPIIPGSYAHGGYSDRGGNLAFVSELSYGKVKVGFFGIEESPIYFFGTPEPVIEEESPVPPRFRSRIGLASFLHASKQGFVSRGNCALEDENGNDVLDEDGEVITH